jgi:PAS domain S-box-containing protein
MENKNILNILFVEDLPSDAELAVLELRKEGLRFEHLRVDTRDEFIKALNEFKPDIVISDYMMPSYNGMLALIDAREFYQSIPFILCTGSMNEETAVECIKAGATDYVIKEHLTRLPFAVKEAIEQHRIQIEKRAADLLLKENEEKLQSIFRAAPVGIGLVVDRIFIEVNDTFCKMTGYSRKELIGKKSEIVYTSKEEYDSVGIDKYMQIAEKGTGSVETRFKCKDGRILNIFLSSTPLDKDDLTKGVTFTVLDITDRIQAEEALANEKYLIYSLMNTLPDHIYFKDLSSRFIRINKAQARFFGLSDPGQAVGKTDSDFFSGEHANQAYEDEQTIIRTGKSINIEEKETHINRPETWVSTVKLPLKDKDGNIIGTFGISRDITKRKITEEALQKSQHLFQTLSQISPVGIFRTDADGSTTYVNPKWSELSGLSSKEAIGEGWLNAVHPEDRERLSELWGGNLKSKNESSAEYRFLKPDGSVIWVMGKAVPELIDNEVNGYIGTITDITERKRVEEELKKNQSQLVNAHIIAHLGSWEYDVENDTYIFNDPFYAIFRTTAEQVGGYTMKSADYAKRFVHPDDVFLVGSETRKANETDDPNFTRQLEHRIIYADGETGYVTVRFIIEKNIKGKTIRTFGVNQDITERKKAEEALRESEKKFRSIMENSADAIFITDQQGRYVYTNKAVTDMLGFSSEEMKSKTILDMAPQNRKDEYLEIFSQLHNKDKIFTEIELLKKNGTFISTDLNAIILPGGLVYGSSRDITERKHAKEELIKAKDKAEEGDRLKTAFLHNISHEIRTPMNAIVGFCDLLREPNVDASSSQEYINFIIQSSNHLLAIISDIVDISNFEANLVKTTKECININSELKLLYDHFLPMASEKKIKLVCESGVPDADAIIITDSSRLTQILINLISNAIKFTDKGFVKVEYVLISNFLEFHVSDTGIGISEEYHNKIFDRFYQVEQTLSRLYEGTGLGLSITKANVDLLGGEIWLSSEPGKGTTFFFTIPYERPGEEALAINKEEVTEGIVFSERKTILVAEDIDSNFKLVKSFLSNANAEIIRAANGKEAVEKCLSNKKIDLILMDIKMPVMDGYTAVKLIREINSTIPIIAQTAYIDDRKQAIESGCSGFISKPFDKKNLLKVLHEFI